MSAQKQKAYRFGYAARAKGFAMDQHTAHEMANSYAAAHSKQPGTRYALWSAFNCGWVDSTEGRRAAY